MEARSLRSISENSKIRKKTVMKIGWKLNFLLLQIRYTSSPVSPIDQKIYPRPKTKSLWLLYLYTLYKTTDGDLQSRLFSLNLDSTSIDHSVKSPSPLREYKSKLNYAFHHYTSSSVLLFHCSFDLNSVSVITAYNRWNRWGLPRINVHLGYINHTLPSIPWISVWSRGDLAWYPRFSSPDAFASPTSHTQHTQRILHALSDC
jgi:hypothetical protein